MEDRGEDTIEDDRQIIENKLNASHDFIAYHAYEMAQLVQNSIMILFQQKTVITKSN